MLIPPPPSLADLPAGTQLVAGMGVSTVLADLDFETYSEAGYVWGGARWECLPRASQGKKGLSVVGAARYAEHPSTEILCLAYDLKDGRGRRMWKAGGLPPVALFRHIARGGLLEAWNVGFERHIWEQICVKRLGWPAVPREQWRCTMAKARAHALPGALGNAAQVIGTAAQKDAAGKRLLDRFSVPRQPTKSDTRLRIRPEEDLEGPRLYAYCDQDIVTEAEISSLTPDLIESEQEYWLVDQAINSRGVAIDMDSVRGCTAIVEAALARYNTELHTLTGGIVSAASEIQRLTRWLGAQGCHTGSLDEESVTEALTRTDLEPAARRALEIRALVGSASVKKLFAMANQVCSDGRLRDLYSYHAARTGRPTGNGPQPTNLPASGPPVWWCLCCGKHHGASLSCCPWCGTGVVVSDPHGWGAPAVEDALEVMRPGSLDLAEMFFGDALPAISGCLRGMFVAAPGHDLICSDYSAIEAVVVAELAGETWRQEVFRTHGKIYEASASKVSGVPLEEILAHRAQTGQHHPLRKKGKVFELALAYGGFVGALVAFGADKFMTEDEMKTAALDWRRASPAVVEFWGGQTRNRQPCLFGLEGCAVSAVMNPGAEYSFRGHTFVMRGDVLYLKTVSGGFLTYHRPRLAPSTRDYKPSWEVTLSFEGWNSNPKNGGFGWIRMETYGPKICENVVQKTARDIQSHAQILLERAGYPIVLHTYDENVAEIPEGWGSIEEFESIMATMPAWAAGWPIRAAGGWRGKRYRKE